ncbi:MAG: hypothetical protein IJY64_04010 [Bacteroidaceae bacterium]|nr:hypothetical protein [Bacteroidaceae bacterium]
MKRYFFYCRLILPLLLLSLVVSCRTRENCESNGRVNEQYLSFHTRDSIFLHDSVRVRESADTVFVTRIRTLYRDRLRTDTLLMCDTVTKVVKEIIESKKNSCSMWSIAAVLLLIFLILWRSGIFSLLRQLIEK